MLVKHEQLTGQIIKAFYTVYHALGYGFLEKVYENSLAIELRKMKLAVVQQAEIKVYYAGFVVGEYYADLLVAMRSSWRSRRCGCCSRNTRLSY